MNTPFFIASRLIKERKSGATFSRPINTIAIIGIALGLAVGILAVSILTGFKTEIRNKVAGFGSHIQVVNFDSNISYETAPINIDQPFVETLRSKSGFEHIQVFATKAGIIKTEDNIQGIVLKGIGTDYDWSFFSSNMVEGSTFHVTDSARTDEVIISNKVASLLKLKVGDDFAVYFVQDPPRQRKFTISGIYETSLEEFDKIYVFCDIGHIRRLNGWSENQASGLEIFVDNFDLLDFYTWEVRDAIGYKLAEDEDKLKVTNIRIRYPQIFDWLNFQDVNVIVIMILLLIVAGFNMISGLLILILEKTNLIGILKALGSEDKMVRKIFIYQAAYLVAKGLVWGNLVGIGLALIQQLTGFITLDPASYYLKTVPVNIEIIHLFYLNAGTMLAIVLMLLIPSRIISSISPVKAIRFE